MRPPKVRNAARILTTLKLRWASSRPSRGPLMCHFPRASNIKRGYVRLPATPTARQRFGLAHARFGMFKTPAKACRSFRSLALPGPLLAIGYLIVAPGTGTGLFSAPGFLLFAVWGCR
jgi:hypothetical protein